MFPGVPWSQLKGQCRSHSHCQSLSACSLLHGWATLVPGHLAFGAAFQSSHRDTFACGWMPNHCFSVREALMRDVLFSHETDITPLHACSVTCLHPTLCHPMDCSPPGSSVHGILQARILEWVAIPFSRGSSRLRDQTHIFCLLHWQASSLPLSYLGSPCRAQQST